MGRGGYSRARRASPWAAYLGEGHRSGRRRAPNIIRVGGMLKIGLRMAETTLRVRRARAGAPIARDTRLIPCLDSGDPAHGSGSPVSRKTIRSARASHRM